MRKKQIFNEQEPKLLKLALRRKKIPELVFERSRGIVDYVVVFVYGLKGLLFLNGGDDNE